MAVSRILGLDPGSRFTGYGCVEAEGSRCRLVAHGRISCSSRAPLPERLAHLCRELRGLLERFAPSIAVLEDPFHGVNSRSLIVLSQARGALLATLGEAELPVAEYSPAAVKKAVTGNGRADKQQVIRMVRILLRDSGSLSTDAADALAVALCFAAHGSVERALAAAGAGSPRGTGESVTKAKPTALHAQGSP